MPGGQLPGETIAIAARRFGSARFEDLYVGICSAQLEGALGGFANEETRTLILYARRQLADFLEQKKGDADDYDRRVKLMHFAIAGSGKDRGGRPLWNLAPSHPHLQKSGKYDNLRGMFKYSKDSNGKSGTVSGSMLPRSISELRVRDIAWIIAGMLLAYLATLL